MRFGDFSSGGGGMGERGEKFDAERPCTFKLPARVATALPTLAAPEPNGNCIGRGLASLGGVGDTDEDRTEDMVEVLECPGRVTPPETGDGVGGFDNEATDVGDNGGGSGGGKAVGRVPLLVGDRTD